MMQNNKTCFVNLAAKGCDMRLVAHRCMGTTKIVGLSTVRFESLTIVTVDRAYR